MTLMRLRLNLSGKINSEPYIYAGIDLLYIRLKPLIIESVDSISKDERGFPLTQYITNGRISRGGYTFTHFKHHHRVLRLISKIVIHTSAQY